MKSYLEILIIILLLCTFLSCVSAKTLTINSITSEPKMDGVLNEECWQRKPDIAALHLLDSEEFPTQATSVWICSDDKALYFGIKCDESQPGKIFTASHGEDSPVAYDDCVEVFIKPGTSLLYHFAANFDSGRFDAMFDTNSPYGKTSEDDRWDGVWTASAKRSENGWTMEICIPFSGLGIGSSPFLVNVGRSEQPHSETSCWPASSFYTYTEYAQLQGINLDPKRYGLKLADISIGQKPGRNNFSASVIENSNPEDKTVLRISSKKYPDGKPIISESEVSCKQGEKLAMEYNVPLVASGFSVEVLSELIGSDGKTRFSACSVKPASSEFSVKTNYPFYYYEDRYIEVKGNLKLDESILKQSTIIAAVINMNGKPLGIEQNVSVDSATGQLSGKIPLKDIPIGDYLIEVIVKAGELTPQPVAEHYPFAVRGKKPIEKKGDF